MDAPSRMEHRSAGLSRRTALTFVILLGVVSLFADMTYEGARSITGPYLAVLGASATVVGIVAGFGELIGYVLRLVAGYLSERIAQVSLPRSISSPLRASARKPRCSSCRFSMAIFRISGADRKRWIAAFGAT